MKNESKLALVFPGIGYTQDKPLLYYTARLARSDGYMVVEVPYKNLPEVEKGSAQSREAAFKAALEQADQLVGPVNLDSYESILCISKSMGTTVAAAFAQKHGIEAAHILFTPVEETFTFPIQKALAFHGTQDQWFNFESCRASCRNAEVPLHLIEDANHSLETGNILKDISHLAEILDIAQGFIASLG